MMQKDPQLDFNVMLTTYDMVLNDYDFLKNFKYKYVVFDEGMYIYVSCLL